jgi:hypothetical protein
MAHRRATAAGDRIGHGNAVVAQPRANASWALCRAMLTAWPPARWSGLAAR